MPADDGSKRCLCDRADRLVEVLNRNNGSDGILDPEVRDGGHVDRHIVFGDDALRLDRHRHDSQRHAVHTIDEGRDQDHARASAGSVRE
jgi:hypothetical protein